MQVKSHITNVNDQHWLCYNLDYIPIQFHLIRGPNLAICMNSLQLNHCLKSQHVVWYRYQYKIIFFLELLKFRYFFFCSNFNEICLSDFIEKKKHSNNLRHEKRNIVTFLLTTSIDIKNYMSKKNFQKSVCYCSEIDFQTILWQDLSTLNIINNVCRVNKDK